MADRLIDAHAAEVACDVQRLATIVGNGPTWSQEMLFIIGRLYLLIQGFKRFDSLSVEEQVDLRAATGWLPRINWTLDKESESQQEAGKTEQIVRDYWYVVRRHDESAGRRKRQLIWLWGNTCNRFALLSHILYRREDFDVQLLSGSLFDATLNFYPSRTPLRAQLLTLHDIPRSQPWHGNRSNVRRVSSPPSADESGSQMSAVGNPSIEAVMQQYAESIAQNPWLRTYPIALSGITARRDDGKWSLKIRLDFCFRYLRSMIMVGKSRLLVIKVIFRCLVSGMNGRHLVPLTVWNKTRFIELQVLRGIK